MPPNLIGGWTATEKNITDRRPFIQKGLNALYGALEYMRNNPDYAIKTIAANNELPLEIAKMEFEKTFLRLSRDGQTKLASVEKALELAAASGVKDMAPAAEVFHEHADHPHQAVARGRDAAARAADRRRRRRSAWSSSGRRWSAWGGSTPSLAPAPSTILPALVGLAGRPEVLASLGVTAWEVLAAFLIAVPVGLVPRLPPGRGARSSAACSALSSTSCSACPSRSSCPCSSWCSASASRRRSPSACSLLSSWLSWAASPRWPRCRGSWSGQPRLRRERWQTIREIYLPAMAPILLESARLGMIFNITAVLLCEIYGARDGIGYRIAAWGENLQMPQLYAALVIVAAAAVAVNEAAARGRVAPGRLEATA